MPLGVDGAAGWDAPNMLLLFAWPNMPELLFCVGVPKPAEGAGGCCPNIGAGLDGPGKLNELEDGGWNVEFSEGVEGPPNEAEALGCGVPKVGVCRLPNGFAFPPKGLLGVEPKPPDGGPPVAPEEKPGREANLETGFFIL